MPNSETEDPGKPEPKPDATLRLSAGEPPDPNSALRLDLSDPLDSGRTLKLPLGTTEPISDETQRLLLPRMDELPAPLLSAEQPATPAGQTLKPTLSPGTISRKSSGWMLLLVLGLMLVLALVAYFAFLRAPQPAPLPQPLPAPASESAPPAVKALLEQAKAGDVHSMHLLGLMYYNGLNVPRDQEKGLYWLRKAAEKGSDAARAELSQIEGGR
jgi:Sel1 repeat